MPRPLYFPIQSRQAFSSSLGCPRSKLGSQEENILSVRAVHPIAKCLRYEWYNYFHQHRRLMIASVSCSQRDRGAIRGVQHATFWSNPLSPTGCGVRGPLGGDKWRSHCLSDYGFLHRCSWSPKFGLEPLNVSCVHNAPHQQTSKLGQQLGGSIES